MKIAICDDDVHFCGNLEKMIMEFFRTFAKDTAIEIFYSGEQLLKYLCKDEYFDLIFLDIRLNKLNGIDVGKKIRKDLNNNTTNIIYVSNYESFALELFAVKPLRFLIKPIKENKLKEALKEAVESAERDETSFEYSSGGSVHKILLKDILYFKSDKRKIAIILQDEIREFYGHLSDVQKQLENDKFIFIHNSFLVNFNYVEVFNSDQIKLINEEILPISRSHRKTVNSKLLKYKERL